MGCNCKSDKTLDGLLNDGPKIDRKIGQKIVLYTLKSLGFLLMLAALPIINLFIIWFIFKTLVLNEQVDIKPLLYAIGKKFKEDDSDEDDDEDDDYYELTEDDVIMENVEDITGRHN